MKNGKRVSLKLHSRNREEFFFRTIVYSSDVILNFYNFSKPSGLRAGRKLVNHRRHERWSSKQYNKSHSVTAMKANPLGGSCMSKGIVLEKM